MLKLVQSFSDAAECVVVRAGGVRAFSHDVSTFQGGHEVFPSNPKEEEKRNREHCRSPPLLTTNSTSFTVLHELMSGSNRTYMHEYRAVSKFLAVRHGTTSPFPDSIILLADC